jgi:hypothetical protein
MLEQEFLGLAKKSLRRRGIKKYYIELLFKKGKTGRAWWVLGECKLKGKPYDFYFKNNKLSVTRYVDYSRQILGTRKWLVASILCFFYRPYCKVYEGINKLFFNKKLLLKLYNELK